MDESVNSISFERERLQFCEKMYDIECSRGENIERKAQFYLTLLTFFIGVLSLKAESWSSARLFLMTLWRAHPFSAGLIWAEASFCAVAVASSFLFIALVFRPRSRNKVYPRNLVARLFISDSEESSSDELTLLRENAERYARAVEENNIVNTEISKWLVRASTMTIASLILFGALISTVFVVYLRL